MKTAFTTSALILSAALSVASVSAVAAPISGEKPFFLEQTATTSSTMSRADVKAEYMAAKKAGVLPVNGEVVRVFEAQQVATHPTRADVKAEYLQARKTGTLPRSGEMS